MLPEAFPEAGLRRATVFIGPSLAFVWLWSCWQRNEEFVVDNFRTQESPFWHFLWAHFLAVMLVSMLPRSPLEVLLEKEQDTNWGGSSCGANLLFEQVIESPDFLNKLREGKGTGVWLLRLFALPLRPPGHGPLRAVGPARRPESAAARAGSPGDWCRGADGRKMRRTCSKGSLLGCHFHGSSGNPVFFPRLWLQSAQRAFQKDVHNPCCVHNFESRLLKLSSTRSRYVWLPLTAIFLHASQGPISMALATFILGELDSPAQNFAWLMRKAGHALPCYSNNFATAAVIALSSTPDHLEFVGLKSLVSLGFAASMQVVLFEQTSPFKAPFALLSRGSALSPIFTCQLEHDGVTTFFFFLSLVCRLRLGRLGRCRAFRRSSPWRRAFLRMSRSTRSCAAPHGRCGWSCRARKPGAGGRAGGWGVLACGFEGSETPAPQPLYTNTVDLKEHTEVSDSE